MKQLNKWLKNPKRDYKEGVELYKRHKGADQFYSFFSKKEDASPKDPEYKMLVQRLTKVQRIEAAKRKKQPQKPEPKKRTKDIKVTDIKGNKKSGHVEGLRQNSKYLSKILSLKWKDLDQRDKEVFFDKKEYFEYKRRLFIEISDNVKEIKTLHVSLKKNQDKKERAGILNQMKSLEDGNTELWQKIDDWVSEIPGDDQNKDPMKRGVELQKKKDNLKGSIRRTQNKLKNNVYKTEKTKKNAEQRVVDMQKELEKLENETA